MTSPGDSNHPVYDHLQLGANPNLLALLDQLCLENGEDAVEVVKFAALASKINPMKRRQSRVLLVTDKALYNFKKDSYSNFRRRIPIEHIRGMVIARHSNEIVFQIQQGYDYHYICEYRLGVVEVVGTFYERLTKKKFEVCISEESNLTSYVLTKTEWRNLAPELVKRRSSTHPEKVYHPKASATTWLKHNFKSFFQHKTSEVDSVLKCEWITYENDSIWQQYFVLLKPRSLVFLKARQKGSFDVLDLELSNEMESDNSSLTSGETDEKKFNLKGSEEPPRFCFSICSDRLKRACRLGSNNQAELANWKSALQESPVNSDSITSGWLYKQDQGVKNWRRYYFVLKSKSCIYFDMDVETDICLKSFHAEAVLGGTSTTVPVNGSGVGALSLNGFPYRFIVKDGRKSYHLAVDSAHLRDDWIWTINATIEEETSFLEVSIAPKSLPDQSFENSQESQVTLVVSDVQGSTMLWERDPQAMNTALEMHDAILRSALTRCKGYEVKTEGDAFVVAFIEALDAIRWSVIVQKELMDAPWPPSLSKIYESELKLDEDHVSSDERSEALFAGLRVRVGIHTGTPRKRRDSITNRIDYSGSDVHLTSRISSAAHGGQIICSDAVVRAAKAQMVKDDEFSLIRLPGSYKLQQVKNPKLVVLYEIWPTGLEKRKQLLPPLRARRVSINSLRSHFERSKDEDENPQKPLLPFPLEEKCRMYRSFPIPAVKSRIPDPILANTR